GWLGGGPVPGAPPGGGSPLCCLRATAECKQPPRLLLRRRHAQDAARRVVGGEPKRAVGPLPHIANAFAQLLQQALLLDHLVAGPLEPHQDLAGERADKDVAAPGGKQVACGEGHSGWGDRGHPVPDRLLHAFLAHALVDPGAVVVDAIADHRPAVVPATFDHVDLVAATRPVLMLPQPSGRRIEREPLRIAVAIAPDFRHFTRSAAALLARRNGTRGP